MRKEETALMSKEKRENNVLCKGKEETTSP
jgi:hypothetical protein